MLAKIETEKQTFTQINGHKVDSLPVHITLEADKMKTDTVIFTIR